MRGDEIDRLLEAPELGETDHSSDHSVGEYILIDPRPGRLIAFPSWLQHAVMPLTEEIAEHTNCTNDLIEPTAERNSDSKRARVSVACNYDLQHVATDDI